MSNMLYSVKGVTMSTHAPVAQLDRALVSGTKGRGFESLRVYQAKSLAIAGPFAWFSTRREG